MVLMLTGCSLLRQQPPVPDAVNLREGLGLNEREGWIVLSRPNSIWTVGTVIEVLPGRDARDLGTLVSLGCFPEEAWLITSGTGPVIQYNRAINYGLSASATLGLPKAELAKAGLNFGGDGRTPTHKTVVVLNKVTEKRVDSLKAEEFLMANHESMSGACMRNLLDPSRFIVDKVLLVEDGEMEVAEVGGAKVDLSSPNYKLVRDAAVNAGYSVTSDGSLRFPVGTPITIAIRQADFGTTLARMGIRRRGIEATSVMEALVESGQAIPY
jgi:hypothetical protein